MQNITVRSSLMGVLCIFSLMILLGAAIGVLALGQANRSTLLVHQIATQVIAVNDAYKDTTRTRSALTRAYSELKEKGEQADLSALANAQTTYQRTLDTLTAFGGGAAFAGQDDALKAGLLASGKQLSDDLSGALGALRARDTAAYIDINNKKITPDGAAFSSQLEKFQKLSNQLADGLVAEREADYRRVIGLMVAGLVAALVLVVAVHVMLKRVVLAPLNRAVALLEQVAQGDLTMRIAASGRNEIGLLLAAIRRMQQGLLDTVSRVRTGSDLINTGAHEIAAGNLDLSARTETQASSLEETAASMEELTATVRRNADNAVEAHQLAQAASGTARKGSEVMGEMAGIMGAIDASSRKIVDIISLIDGIAFQTNILALNAAVEAARAGEQGRGFAVVATEVRNLAQRSAVAAKEIKVLIDASAGQIDAGGKLAGQAGATMAEVVESVQRVTSIVTEIAHASSEQRDGIEQVNQAVLQMDQVTQQNAALVEQAAAAAQSLHTQAAELADTVSIFQINAADRRGAAASTTPNRRLTPF